MVLIDQYNPYLTTHSLVMQRMKKSIAILFADCTLLQHTNLNLFKANMGKKTRMQKKKEKRANATYGSAFGRVLTPAQAAAARREALEKEETAQAKKVAITNRKLAAAIKKKEMEEAKLKRSRARQAKKQQKEKAQHIKALNSRPQQQHGSSTQQELPALQQTRMVFESQLEAGLQYDGGSTMGWGLQSNGGFTTR